MDWLDAFAEFFAELAESLFSSRKGNKSKEECTMITTELVTIIERFAESGWELIEAPSKKWLAADGSADTTANLVKAVEQANQDCGGCGCEFDPLYQRALELLQVA